MGGGGKLNIVAIRRLEPKAVLLSYSSIKRYQQAEQNKVLCCHLVERESWCLFHSTPFCGHRRGVFKSKIKDSEFTTPWKRNYLLLKRKRSTVFSHLHVSVCKCDTLSDSYSTETVSLARLLDMFSLPSQPLGYLCPFCEAMTQMSLMSTWCSRLCPVSLSTWHTGSLHFWSLTPPPAVIATLFFSHCH